MKVTRTHTIDVIISYEAEDDNNTQEAFGEATEVLCSVTQDLLNKDCPYEASIVVTPHG